MLEPLEILETVRKRLIASVERDEGARSAFRVLPIPRNDPSRLATDQRSTPPYPETHVSSLWPRDRVPQTVQKTVLVIVAYPPKIAHSNKGEALVAGDKA